MSPDPSSLAVTDGRPRRWLALVFVLILIVFVVENLGAMRVTTATSDETSHLPAGYSYLTTGDYRLNPQHPPLAKLLAALPLLALAPKIDTADPGWTAFPPDEWGFGARFLYGNDAGRILFWGRLPIVMLGMIACLYVRLWARDLYGESAGLAAAALFVLCPTIVGHAHLVTMDVALAAFLVGALYHLRSWGIGGSPGHLLGAGIATGCALATKFSAVVAVPAIAALVVLAVLARARRGALRHVTIALGVLLVSAAGVVWLTYGCPADPLFYWNGLRMVNQDHNATVPDYLLGEFRTGGFWYYFPVAFVLKTPIPTLGLIAAGLVVPRPRGWRAMFDVACLFLLPALFLAATMALAAGIGVRYLIPLYPPLIVAASRVVPPLLRSTAGRMGAAAIVTWLLFSAAQIHPDYLAYFNEAAGGPENGPQLLDDSNLEWGGGLARLKDWMDARGIASVRLLYPWNGSPEYYGIRSTPVTRHDWLVEPSPGIYAISTVALVRGRLTAREQGANSDWLDRYAAVDRVGYDFRIYAFGERGIPVELPR